MEYKISTEFEEYGKLIESLVLVREEFFKIHKTKIIELLN